MFKISNNIAPQHALIFIIYLSFISLRFWNLSAFPVFGDEALYLMLADKISFDINSFFYPLDFGVMPLAVWILKPATILSPFINPLIFGRALMVSFDIFSAFFIFLSGRLLFNTQMAILGSLIYLSLPINFFHSRMILLESLTNLLALIAIYFLLKITLEKNTKKTVDKKSIFLISMFFALSFFTKPLTIVYLPIFFIIFLIKFFENKTNIKKILTLDKNLLISSLLTIILIAFIYIMTIEFLSRHSALSNTTITTALIYLKTNLWKSWWWARVYFSDFLLLAVFASTIFSIFKKQWRVLFLAIWSISMIIISSFMALNYYPRHIYPLAAPVSLIAAYCLLKVHALNKLSFLILTILILIGPLTSNIKLAKDPLSANMALEDRQQYLEDWTSGAGLKEVSALLKDLASDKKIIVLTDNSMNEIWILNNIYLNKKLNNIIYADKKMLDRQALDLSSFPNYEKYLLLNKYQDIPAGFSTELIFSHPRGPNRSLKLYKII